MSGLSGVVDLLGEILQALRAMGASRVSLSEKPFLSVEEAVAFSSLSRTTLYEALRRGDFDARVFGNRTLVDRESLVAWLRGLPSYEPGGARWRGVA